MKNISVSKIKSFKNCKLAYKYNYIDHFIPVEEQPAEVTSKGLCIHEIFDQLLKYENYKDDKSQLKYRDVNEKLVLDIFRQNMESNKLSIEQAERFQLKKGIKRWLSFKHDYLDKRNHILYAEQKYTLPIFEGTETTAILDLLEDNRNNTYNIYDYKTPRKINNSDYKYQLLIYVYLMSVVKNMTDINNPNYEEISKHFNIFIFYPLCEGDHETYEKSLKQIKYKSEDLKETIEDLKSICNYIDNFDFEQPAEVLQTTTVSTRGPCSWCNYFGTKPQPEINFEGCPITHFMGILQKSLIKKKT